MISSRSYHPINEIIVDCERGISVVEQIKDCERGIDYRLRPRSMNIEEEPIKGQRLMDMNEELKEGHQLDLVKILSSQQRDYLLRNNGDQVKIESLKGKIVVLYIKKLGSELLSSNTTQDIIEAYKQLAVKEDLEIVFVATQEGEDVEDEELFNKCFSKMPWLAIPYVDLETRMLFVVPYGCVLLDKNGIVLKTEATDLFINFGASWYPFTEERLKELMNERDEAFKEGTMKSLLSSPSRNYVISNTNEKIPISELEAKIVGLYFYSRNSCSMEWVTPKLINIYNELKARGENFEIVMINLHFICDYNDDERQFEEEFKKMPWLALPFMDQNCRILNQMFLRWFDGCCGMVIIGPGGNILCGKAIAIMLQHGIQAYPFTVEAVIETQISRIKAFTFHSLLVGLGLDMVRTKNGAQFQVSDLGGVKIFLFIGRYGCSESRALFQKLLNWHSNRTDHSFHVIFASSDDDFSSFDSFYKEMPWLTLPFDPKKTKALIETFGFITQTLLVAFGADGRILTTNGQTILYDELIIDDECEVYNDWFDQAHRRLEESIALPGCSYFDYNFYYRHFGEDSEEYESGEASEEYESGEDSEEYESEAVEEIDFPDELLGEDSEEYESEDVAKMEIDGVELVCC